MLFALRKIIARRIPAGSFLRHALAVSSGVTFGQAILFLATPVITRLYSPFEMGTLATLTSLAALILPFATLRFDVAIGIARDDAEAENLTALTLSCTAGIAGVLALLVAAVPGSWWIERGMAASAVELRWALPLLVAAASLDTVMQRFGTYRQAYKALAVASVTRAVGASVVKIGAGLAQAGVLGLLAGDLCRQLLGTGTIARVSGLSVRSVLSRLRWQELLATARMHRRYPMYTLWGSFLNIAGLQAPVQILSWRYSPAESGLYSLGLGAIQAPIGLISAGISNAFISRIRKGEQAGRLPDMVTSMVQALAGIGAPWFALCCAWGPDMVALVFGGRWREGGMYLAFLAPWLYIMFVFASCSMVLNARDMQGKDFGWQLALTSGRIGALCVAGAFLSARWAVAAFALVSFIMLGCYQIWVLRIIGVSLRTTFAYALRELSMYLLPVFAIVLLVWRDALSVPLGFGLSLAVVAAIVAVRFRANPVFRFFS